MIDAPDPNVPYRVEEVVDWDPDGFDTRRDADGATITGACPRCGHEVVKTLRRSGMVAFDRRPDDAVPDADVIRCNCREPTHDGGALGKGCGRYWGVEIDLG